MPLKSGRKVGHPAPWGNRADVYQMLSYLLCRGRRGDSVGGVINKGGAILCLTPNKLQLGKWEYACILASDSQCCVHVRISEGTLLQKETNHNNNTKKLKVWVPPKTNQFRISGGKG